MKNQRIQELAMKNVGCQIKKGVCCTNYCRDCRYMEMDNDGWNDGTRRCAYRGEWLKPSTPACYKFTL